MAEFCKACSKELGLRNDADCVTPVEVWEQNEACLFLCEGCGPIQVDPGGN